MRRKVIFDGKILPICLLLPQLLITIIFFFLPAGQALQNSVLSQDMFGAQIHFAGFDNFNRIFADPNYLRSFATTGVFSLSVAVLALLPALILAVMAERVVRGRALYQTILVLPYALAPVIAGVLWLFIFNPSIGVIGWGLRRLGFDWNPVLNGQQAMMMLIIAAAWKQISYNFLFFLAGLQSIPKSLLEAASIDGAGAWRQFRTITLPLLSPTTFFLLVVNVVYAFFDTFGIIDAITHGGPARATEVLVYKVYYDGLRAMDFGTSSAQSIILMLIVIGLTALQFRYVEKKVHY